jgi:hypothetical protein
MMMMVSPVSMKETKTSERFAEHVFEARTREAQTEKRASRDRVCELPDIDFGDV